MITSKTNSVSFEQGYELLRSVNLDLLFKLGTTMELVPNGHEHLREQLNLFTNQHPTAYTQNRLITYLLVTTENIFSAANVAINRTKAATKAAKEIFGRQLRENIASACREIANITAGIIVWAVSNSKKEILNFDFDAAFFTADWTNLERQLKGVHG